MAREFNNFHLQNPSTNCNKVIMKDNQCLIECIRKTHCNTNTLNSEFKNKLCKEFNTIRQCKQNFHNKSKILGYIEDLQHINYMSQKILDSINDILELENTCCKKKDI